MRGQTLFEAIISLALFSLIAAALVSMATGGLGSLTQGGDYTQAAALADEGIEAVRSIRDGAWNELKHQTAQIALFGTQWVLNSASGPEQIGKFSRDIFVDPVCRDSVTNNITDCSSGYTDPHSKKITSSVSWPVRAGITNTVERVAYITNWDSRDMTTNTKAVFDAGNFNATESRLTDDVILKLFNNWAAARVHSTIQLVDTTDANDVFIDEYSDIMYVVTDARAGDGEFFAYDISNISNAPPVLLGSVELGLNAKAVWADARGYIYVGTGENNSEVKIIKCQTGSCSQVVGTSWDTPGNADVSDLYGSADGSKLVVVTLTDTSVPEAFVVDITNPLSIPANPLFTYEINADANAVTVSGEYAYIATSANTRDLIVLRIFPTYASYPPIDVSMGSAARDVFALNNTLYIGKDASSGNELFSYNISDPASPVAGPAVEIGDSVLGVFVYDGFAYLATDNGASELRVVNVSTPTFSLIGGGDANGAQSCNRVWFYAAYAYLACSNNTDEIQILRGGPSGWQAPILKGSGDTSGSLNGLTVAVSGNYAYVGTQNNSSGQEFYAFLISAQGSATLIGSREINADVNSIYISGNRAYLATSDDARELEVIDITIPANLSLPASYLGAYNADETFNGLSVYTVGTTVYLGTANNTGTVGSCNDDEFYVLNALNPASITCSWSYDVTSNVNSIVVSSPYAYLATPLGNELLVLNIASFAFKWNIDVPGGGDGLSLAVSGNDLFLGRADGGASQDFYIYNISNVGTTGLTQTAAIDTAGDNNGIAIKSGSYIFLSRSLSAGSMKVIDISTINSPVEIGSFDAGSNAQGVAYSSGLDFAFLATSDNQNELQIIGPTPVLTALAKRGTYTSQVFDSGAARALQVLEWVEDITACPSSCSIKMLFRSAVLPGDVIYAGWVGPDGADGDHDDYFSSWRGALIPTDQNNKRYFQWKTIFAGDSSNSPLLKEVRVNMK